MHTCYFQSFFGWGGGWLGMLLTITVLVLAVWLVSRLLIRKRCNFDRRDSLNILKHRLASGEITQEEYEKLKNVI
ncbi:MULTISPECIES: SHOCT domain-containing protein [unclassified Desulfovibrio]|uniref:SHOCT domain-containing protein n=1 Tax=unclassified Desulfovibrio TaxID=2593640 RepID=UPI002FD9714B